MMEIIDYYALSVVIFILLLVIILYKDRKHVERESVLFLRRTQRGKQFIVNLATSHPKFWKWVGNLGVCVGFFVSVFGLYYLIDNIYQIIINPISIPGLAAVVPSLSTTATFGPGYFAVPFWYWIIAIAMLVVIHEGFHGIMFAAERVKIKSLGVGLLAVIPLAFVEPDEKQAAKKPAASQLRAFAAGSFGNFVLAGVMALLLSTAFTGLFAPSGVAFAGVIEGYPAEQNNLTGIIVMINDYDIKTFEDIHVALKEIGADQPVTIKTMTLNDDGTRDYKTFNLITSAPPADYEDQDKGFIGITFGGTPDVSLVKSEFANYEGIIVFFQGLVFFVFLLNFGVGIFNLLPIKPLDGGLMWELLLTRASPKNGKKMAKVLAYATLIIIIINFALPFIKPLFMG